MSCHHTGHEQGNIVCSSVMGAAERYSEIPKFKCLSTSQSAYFTHPVTHVHSIKNADGSLCCLWTFIQTTEGYIIN